MRRREVWRSLRTGDRDEARQGARQWVGQVATLFLKLNESRTMDRAQLDALIDEYLDAELYEAEVRVATGQWRTDGQPREHAAPFDIGGHPQQPAGTDRSRS
jgi:hypothetical protein